MNKFVCVVAVLLVIALFGCGGEAPAPAAESTTAAPATTPTPPAPTIPPATPFATRVGADYVLLLPREAALPADWAMNPIPDYDIRQPQPDETYRFACLDVPARSVGAAKVGYRHLDGLPSIHIEYVIYPTAVDAEGALGDMRRAVDECPTYTLGEGDAQQSASFSPLAFPDYGDGQLAAEMATESATTGPLRVHMVKVRQGHVVIGVNHTAYADGLPIDEALTESLVALAVGNLADGPREPGR